MTFAARIRRVKMKDGADVSILNTPVDPETGYGPAAPRGRIIRMAKNIAGMGTDVAPLDGYIVIGLYSDGSSSIGFRIPERIPTCLIPAYVSELMRRDAVTGQEAERIFDNRFQWVDA